VFWFHKLDDELDNLRIALEWALAADVEAGLRISAIPWRFWQARGYLEEISEWLAQVLERYNTVDTLHVQALAVYSLCIFRRGNFPETIRIAEQSLQMARTLSDQGLEAFSLSFLGVFTLVHGNIGEGVHLLEQSLDIYRALGDKIGQANTLEWLSANNVDKQYAIDSSRESLRLNRELGHLSGITHSLSSLAQKTIGMGDVSSPTRWLEEALSISRQIGDLTSEDEILTVFGILVYWQGDYEQARTYYEEALMLCEKSGDHFQYLWAYVYMAYAVLRQGDIQRAREMFETSIRDIQKADMMIGMVFAIEGLASLNVDQNQPERAALLFAWTDAIREKTGDYRPLIEQGSVEKDLAVIHSQLDDAEFEKLSANGRTMTEEQAIALALEE